MRTEKRPSLRRLLMPALLLVIVLSLLWVPAAQAAPSAKPLPSGGYWYTVVYGDSWTKVAAKTGVSVSALQAANPGKVRPPHYWLYAGEKLWIPSSSPPHPGCGYWYTVVYGDSWTKVAAKTGVSMWALRNANPGKVRPPHYWLYAGEKLWIPCGHPGPMPPPPGGHWYTVQPGDTWYKLSARTGLSIAALQAANPSHIHPHQWLYVGHKLWIPAVPTPY